MTKVLIAMLLIEFSIGAFAFYFVSQPQEIRNGSAYNDVASVVLRVKSLSNSIDKSEFLDYVDKALKNGVFSRWEYDQIILRSQELYNLDMVNTELNEIDRLFEESNVANTPTND